MKKSDRNNKFFFNEPKKLQRNVDGLEAAAFSHADVKKILKSKGLVRTVSDSVGIMVIYVNTAGEVIHSFGCNVNGTAFPNDELTGKKAIDLLAPDDAKEIMADVRKVIKSGRPKLRRIKRYAPFRYRELRLFRDDIIPSYDRDGNIIGAVIVSMDLTKHREAQKALEESEARYRAVVEWSNDGVVLINEEKIVYANQKALDMFGYAKFEDFVGKGFRSYIHPEDVERIKMGYQNIRNGTADYPSFEFVGVRSDGIEIDVDAASTVIRIEDQQIVLLFLRDVTEKKKNEEEKTRLIAELQDALSQIKTLSGMLPICASCKKIRNDEGYWEQIEAYISHHSEAVFSHGICPDCIKKLYPEYHDKHSKK